jgi:hypothetical protein
MLSRCFRVRAKLSSGEMAVPGDQWPLLVYARQEYDPEEPWDGLFRSQLLIWVVIHFISVAITHSIAFRPSNISSPHLAQ